MKNSLLSFSDLVMASVPQPEPSPEHLRRAKIIAHRGNTGAGLRENTLAAFQTAIQAGVWGIEFDVRWTACSTPIIHHDRTAVRVHGVDVAVEELTFKELRLAVPLIPTLEEVVQLCSGKVHLMIELKNVRRGLAKERWAQLKALLRSLEPVRDFHFMCLDYETLLSQTTYPREVGLPIVEFNAVDESRRCLSDGLGGLTGQYLVITSTMINQHHQRKQSVGTGFVGSAAVFYRELNRGVDWIFSDDSSMLCELLRRKIQITP